MRNSVSIVGRGTLARFILLAGAFWLLVGPATAAAVEITRAEWDAAKTNLKVNVDGVAGAEIILRNAYDLAQVLGTETIKGNDESKIRTKINPPDNVPCRIRVDYSEPLPGEPPFAERDVVDPALQGAPADCAPTGDGGPANQPPTAHAGGPYTATVGEQVTFDSNGSSDSDGSIVSYDWDFGDGNGSSGEATSHTYASAGTYTVMLTVTDNDGATGNASTTATISGGGNPGGGGGGPAPEVSINSTSQGSFEAGVDPYAAGPVTEEPAPNDSNSLSPAPGTGNTSHQILAINDLGMHCGDLDSRVASILPPFQVMLSQVIRKGGSPELLGPSEVEVLYSAASNPVDPILSQGDEAFTGLTPDAAEVYKTNFWNVVNAYDPFYPPGLLCTDPADPATCGVSPDTSLPVPNVEELYIGPDGSVNSGDEHLVAVQHAMPGKANPYSVNHSQLVQEHYGSKPFFVNFPFGYVANDINLFEAAGIPLSNYDDFGRENPYPLVRAQAKAPGANGQILATVDTVLPISGEASCKNCHGSPDDVDAPNEGVATIALAEIGVANSFDNDDLYGDVPVDVSVEYATDINILRLHDLTHGGAYVDSNGSETPCTGLTADAPNGNENCLANKALEQGKSVVCQTCHYTPALDLAQLGPLGGSAEFDDPDANGRVQRVNKSNSRVMHDHHGSFTDLFPAMPAPTADGPDGLPGNHTTRQGILEQTCYRCHPGTKTKCMRGAMADGGMVCQDCHGGMKQVGDDFSEFLTTGNAFPGGADLSKRVPWANEPGCGSCHTGDALDSLADDGNPKVAINAVDSFGNPDGIRLIRAYEDSYEDTPEATTPSSPDVDTTPIVPSNKRFAEPVVPESFNGFDNPGAGNPKLYRVSTGHGGIFCEGCHGATHAEWDSDGPEILNDNRTAIQLQGHAGTVIECSTCHTTSELPANTQGGPHGMHLVNDERFWKEAHKGAAKNQNGQPGGGTCGACHGSDHLGTVLSRAADDRNFTVEDSVRTVYRGEPVACDLCHSLGKSFGQ